MWTFYEYFVLQTVMHMRFGLYLCVAVMTENQPCLLPWVVEDVIKRLLLCVYEINFLLFKISGQFLKSLCGIPRFLSPIIMRVTGPTVVLWSNSWLNIHHETMQSGFDSPRNFVDSYQKNALCNILFCTSSWQWPDIC